MKKYVIIVAGGTGTRFGGTLPKQFVPLNGIPVLMQTIKAFHDYDPQACLIVALPAQFAGLWEELCRSHQFDIPHKIADGGATRFDSVKKALAAIPENEGLVAVHDGARPLVRSTTIASGFATAESAGSAVPVVPLTDSVRQIDGTDSHAVDRKTLVAVQTPQIFQIDMLKKAYAAAKSDSFTDDASVVEAAGYKIALYDGDAENIKITHPADLKIAEWILTQRNV